MTVHLLLLYVFIFLLICTIIPGFCLVLLMRWMRREWIRDRELLLEGLLKSAVLVDKVGYSGQVTLSDKTTPIDSITPVKEEELLAGGYQIIPITEEEKGEQLGVVIN